MTVLVAAHRMREPAEFRLCVRRGRRAGGVTVVGHFYRCASHDPGVDTGTADVGVSEQSVDAVRVGIVVSRAVGNAVSRNRVKRRLRHLLRDRLGWLPSGSLLVVRALPAASGASGHQLSGDLDQVLAKLVRRGARRNSHSGGEVDR